MAGLQPRGLSPQTPEFVCAEAAARLACCVCFEVYNDPVQVCSREHHLCRACAWHLQATVRGRKCPECRENLCIKDGQRFLKQSLGGLLVFCPNKQRGCPCTMPLDSLAAHREACPMEPIQCTQCAAILERQQLEHAHLHCDASDVGCQAVFDQEASLRQHCCECPVLKCRALLEKYKEDAASAKQKLHDVLSRPLSPQSLELRDAELQSMSAELVQCKAEREHARRALQFRDAELQAMKTQLDQSIAEKENAVQQRVDANIRLDDAAQDVLELKRQLRVAMPCKVDPTGKAPDYDLYDLLWTTRRPAEAEVKQVPTPSRIQ